jgi:hypothetical protein
MVVHKHRRRRDLRKRHIGYDCFTERSNDSTRPERGEAVARWVGLMASDFRFGQKLTNEARLGMSAFSPQSGIWEGSRLSLPIRGVAGEVLPVMTYVCR